MLCNLHIENIAVAHRVDMDLSSGFSVLTGETGAGKSVIIGALSLLCGRKFDRDMLRAGEEKALVCAVFSDFTPETLHALSQMEIEPDDDGCIYLQRSLNADGRSQCRVNGRTVPTGVLREAGCLLINIHGQHENQKLLDSVSHRDLVDRYAGNVDALNAYGAAWTERRRIAAELDGIRRDDAERARLTEMLEYQIREIDAARLRDGEEELLTAERARLKNADRLSRQCKIVQKALYQNEKGVSACEMIARAQPAIEQIREFLPDAEQYLEKLEYFRSELEDIAQRVSDACGMTEGDPQKALDRVESRLQAISRLERKYGATVADVLAFRRDAAARLSDMVNAEDRMNELGKALKKADDELRRCADELHRTRAVAAERLQEGVRRELAFLDMEKVAFFVRVIPTEPAAGGVDAVSFAIAANPGEPEKPIDRVASGGELSRIMLALKCVLQGRESTDTLIFDEVDTGVSGRTSQRIGVKLRQVAQSAQVICVTHAAQIAAAAHHQYKIQKQEKGGRTESTVTLLSEDERIHEIARIMGGSAITDGLLQSARELRRECERLSED